MRRSTIAGILTAFLIGVILPLLGFTVVNWEFWGIMIPLNIIQAIFWEEFIDD